MHVGLALAVATLAAVLTSDLPATVRGLLSGLGLAAGAAALVVLCLRLRRGATGRPRQAWTLLVLSAGVGGLGSLALLLEQGRGAPGSPSLADLLHTLALALGIAGALTFPAQRRRPIDLVRMSLEGLVLGGSFLFVTSVTLFPQILPPDRTAAAGQLAPLLIAAVDVMVATVAVLLAWRSGPNLRQLLFLVGGAFALFAVSDFGSVVVSAQRPFTLGSPVDLGWVGGYVLLVLAAQRADISPVPARVVPELSPVVGTALLFAVFLVAVAFGVLALSGGALSTPSVVVALVVLGAVAARQLVLIVDHENLRRTLERRVFDRTNALRAITQQTTLLVNSVGEGIYGVDGSGLVTFVNPAAARVLGYAPEEVIGRDAHATFHRPEPSSAGHADGASCYISRALTRQVVTQAAEDAYLRADGTTIPVEVTATPVSQNDRVHGAVVVFRDVTQRREVDRIKNEFVSMVSHELRTPLTSIRGSLGLLGGGAFGRLDPRAGRMVDLALESTDRLTRLVDDILDIERIESGSLPMTPGIHVGSDLVAAAVDQVQVVAAASDVTISVGSVEGWVGADGDRVVQVLINLLSNAIKFSPPQQCVEVGSSVRGGTVEFRVCDGGRGVPPHKLDAIFARFHQVDTSDARVKGGVGLGLSICRNLVERMGGRIWAENNAGAGVTFYFTLPGGRLARPGFPLAPKEESAPGRSPAASEPSPPDPAPRSIPVDQAPTVRLAAARSRQSFR